MVKKYKIKKLKIKNKKKASNSGVNIKINIDQSKRSNNKRATSSKTPIQQPIYYPQQQQARLIEIKPNNYNSPDFTKTIEDYQKQQRQYFDDKLSNYEKEIIEKFDDSLKKKSSMVPPQNIIPHGASHQHTDYEGNEIYNETIINKKAVHNQINNLNEKKPMNFHNNNMVEAEPLNIKSLAKSLNKDERNDAKEGLKEGDNIENLQTLYNNYVNLFLKLYKNGKDENNNSIRSIDYFNDKGIHENSSWSNTIRSLRKKISKQT
jgi:hypothetical protein